jgi:hypothetical protein|mmetsp:Transcript_21538/g.38967  ORF Transcript_21538/g.38967 Transcript_21538/m.38967 type:complete len:210 (+) Transcript_21538:247-876(+)
MSRSFTPPDTLSKEDIRTIADVRRDIWTNGFKGLVGGLMSGYVIHTVGQFWHSRLSEATKMKLHVPGDAPFKFSRNTAFLSVMVGGAVGSFGMATAAGKNRVHKLHDIYDVGKTPTGTDYQKQIAQAQLDDKADRKERRLKRRATVKKLIEEGHGLSDSHGGQWVAESNDQQERRMQRRAKMKNFIEEEHGLSDSHGGQWAQENGDGSK